jgi:hypothetical protein
MSIYNRDIELLVKRLLPTRKRAQWHIDWLISLLKGVQNLYNDFLTFQSATLLQLSYNSQKLLFEKAINDDCDPVLNRIYINNSADDLEASYCYFLSENQDDAYSYNLSEGAFIGRYMYSIFEYFTPYDFIVFVPLALVNLQAKIRAIVEFYKLAGKRYTINFF